MRRESGFIEKKTMTSQFSEMTSFSAFIYLFIYLFWHCLVSLVKFSYWSKFHVNIITSSGVMTIIISYDKRLTRNLEIGNAPVWVLPNIWRLGWIRYPNLARTSLMNYYWMLQNARVTAFTVLFRENLHGR